MSLVKLKSSIKLNYVFENYARCDLVDLVNYKKKNVMLQCLLFNKYYSYLISILKLTYLSQNILNKQIKEYSKLVSPS